MAMRAGVSIMPFFHLAGVGNRALALALTECHMGAKSTRCAGLKPSHRAKSDIDQRRCGSFGARRLPFESMRGGELSARELPGRPGCGKPSNPRPL